LQTESVNQEKATLCRYPSRVPDWDIPTLTHKPY
jgi:hypothetical protein